MARIGEKIRETERDIPLPQPVPVPAPAPQAERPSKGIDGSFSSKKSVSSSARASTGIKRMSKIKERSIENL